jgi:hypothetical protein
MNRPRPAGIQLPENAPPACDALRVLSYELDEVLLPATRRRDARTAVRIVIRGRNFRDRAVPLWATVGDVPVQQLRLDEATQTLEGVLLAEPRRGSRVRVSYADMEYVEHPEPFDPAKVRR